MKCSIIIVTVVIVLYGISSTDAWSGNYETYLVRRVERHRYCACWYWWWGCSYWLMYSRVTYVYTKRCQAGWKHNENNNCNIPICSPTCANGGNCTSPNLCTCPSTTQGPGCNQLTCSYQRPCYPGECHDGSDCTCHVGFSKASPADGCINIDSEDLRPVIGKSNVTLADIRRTDNRINYMFTLEATDTTDLEIIWSNQKRFNNLRFELEALFTQPIGEFPKRPTYVHEAQLGIAESRITANVSKVPRDGGLIRDYGSFKTYICESGFSKDNPALELASCVIDDDQFKTLIEHADWLTIIFKSTSGGFQSLINLDAGGSPYDTKYYKGLTDIKTVEFRFDFIAPTHCSENTQNTCARGDAILKVHKEFTQTKIRMSWSGWNDDLSGMLEYYVEIFKLSVNGDGRLEEMSPLDPVYNETIDHNDGNIVYPTYRPNEPGMYSVLLEARDMSNNSRIARRFVLFDDQSSVTIHDTYKLYFSSAVPETGYMWQTTTGKDQDVTLTVAWTNHFVNSLHESGKFLARIENYPIQFNEIKDDGVLYSQNHFWIGLDRRQVVFYRNTRYNTLHALPGFLPVLTSVHCKRLTAFPHETAVEDVDHQKYSFVALDDNTGKRTQAPIKNVHGIVQFEVNWQSSVIDTTEPTSGWTVVQPLQETISQTRKLDDGDGVRIWVRATDIMGNSMSDTTFMKVDATPPVVSTDVSTRDTPLDLNVDDGPYTYSSRIVFAASDHQSGVHKYSFDIMVKAPGKPDQKVYSNFSRSNMPNDTVESSNPFCTFIEGQCFMVAQTLDIDNCWLTVNKADLDHATAAVKITAYNQAMLTSDISIDMGKINQLQGLEKYDGPQNFRAENESPNGFRLVWDLPEHESCYGRADIVIVLSTKNSSGEIVLHTYYTLGTSTHFDILGLDPEVEYSLGLQIKSPGASAQETGTTLKVTTPAEKDESGASVWEIVGVAVGVLVIVALVVIVLVVQIRRGIIEPRKRASQIRRTISQRVRQSRMSEERYVTTTTSASSGCAVKAAAKPKCHYAYDTRQSELYVYGGMDMNTSHISRSNVTFETQLKDGHFAIIYKAKLNGDVVVAKTLKMNYTPEDELLMKAKINFTVDKIGDHPNVLKFIGAVTDDGRLGPFMIYEYCENGTLKDYLLSNKGNVTIELQENLFRFGLNIAKGMEYLADRRIVHRRLAARNILLNFVNDVKISGFGPQPDEDGDGDPEKAKKERIPIKWMAPECMSSTKDANEKSDVWSYAVVLWEIFSLGDTPYSTGRGRDLPDRLKKGERLGKPEQCDDTWYAVMQRCWAYEPKKRPKFSKVRNDLDTMFVSAPGDDYYYYKH